MIIVTGGTHGIGRACVEKLARDLRSGAGGDAASHSQTDLRSGAKGDAASHNQTDLRSGAKGDAASHNQTDLRSGAKGDAASHNQSAPRGIVFTGRDAEAGEQLAATLPGTHFIAGDVAREEDVRRVVDKALDLGGGKLTGLVNNAGMSRRISFADATCEDWDVVMNVNARSAFLFTRWSLAGLRAGRGAVVNIASVAGMVGEEGLAVYCASKAAVIAMTEALALEFGAEVRFNAICPGQIETRMMAKVMTDPFRVQQLEQRIPAGRFGSPQEVADVVVWLLSDRATYVNGVVFAVDGGETAGLRTPRLPQGYGPTGI